MKYSVFLLLILVVTVTQAATDEELIQKVRATGIVQAQESILLASNVYFYPRRKGLGLMGGTKKRTKGQIILTAQALSVLEWQRLAKKYEVIHHELYADMRSVELVGGSLVARLVTQNQSTGIYNSFEIMDSRNSVTANPEKMRKAKQIIQQGISGLEIETVSQNTEQTSRQEHQAMESLEARIQRLEKMLNQSALQQQDECNCECPQ